MIFEYEKTHYEELVESLENAFIAGRKIKNIIMSQKEFDCIKKYIANIKFTSSIKSKVYISKLELTGDIVMPRTAYIGYQVIEKAYQQSATLYMVKVTIT